jgi:hypothetical protein
MMKPFAGAAVALALLASATLTLILLGSATPASAQEAWALWDQDVIAVDGQAPAVMWFHWGSFTTKDGCEEQRRKELEHYEQMSKLYPTDWVKQGDMILAKDKGKVVRRSSYYCYASTINPRWEYLTAGKNWYLMGPPRTKYDATAAYLRGIQVLPDRALSQWSLLDAHDSRQECEIMRDVLRRAEQAIYNKSAADYLQAMGQQPEPPASQRYMVEMYHSNVRTYVASRCVSRDDPGLPRGLRAK